MPQDHISVAVAQGLQKYTSGLRYVIEVMGPWDGGRTKAPLVPLCGTQIKPRTGGITHPFLDQQSSSRESPHRSACRYQTP